MKKITCLILSLLTFIVAGCSQDYSSEEITTEAVEDKFPEFKYDSTVSPYYQRDNHTIAVAEDGYYFIRNQTKSCYDNFVNTDYKRLEADSQITGADSHKYGKLIYYYDINKGTSSPLCSRIGCNHDDIECEAYFDNVSGDIIGDNSGFVYYNRRLYMISYDEKKGLKLISYDSQGKNQKEECIISDNPEYVPCFGSNNDICIFNGYVYCWGKRSIETSESASSEIVLFKSDISGNDRTVILNMTENAEQSKYTSNFTRDIEVANNKIYVKTCMYDENEDMFTYILYESDGDKSSELTEILRTKSPRDCNKRIEGQDYASLKNYALDNHGNLFYFDEIKSEGMKIDLVLYKYNLSTKEKIKIYETEAVGYSVMCDEDYLYISICGGESDYIAVLDKNGQVKYSKEYRVIEPETGNRKNSDCMFVGIDERYAIVICDYKADLPFNNYSDGNVKVPDAYIKYGILEKSSIGSGNEELILMYDGMYIQ